MVGTRFSSSLKYFWIHSRSSTLMARPRFFCMAAMSASERSRNPSIRSTSAGSSQVSSSVSGFSSAASLASMGFTRYFFTFSNSSSVRLPFNTNTLAAATRGFSFWVISWIHWAAKSSRWSYWPGSSSTANTFSSAAGTSSSITVSTGGSDNTNCNAWENSSSVRPITS